MIVGLELTPPSFNVEMGRRGKNERLRLKDWGCGMSRACQFMSQSGMRVPGRQKSVIASSLVHFVLRNHQGVSGRAPENSSPFALMFRT